MESGDLNGVHQAPYNYQPYFLHMHDVTPASVAHAFHADNSASCIFDVARASFWHVVGSPFFPMEYN